MDEIHGIRLDSEADHLDLAKRLLRTLPKLTVWELPCTPWSTLQAFWFLSPTRWNPKALFKWRRQEEARAEHAVSISLQLHEQGCFYLHEAPKSSAMLKTRSYRHLKAQPFNYSFVTNPCATGTKGAGTRRRHDTHGAFILTLGTAFFPPIIAARPSDGLGVIIPREAWAAWAAGAVQSASI